MEESLKPIVPTVPRDALSTEAGWARAVEIHQWARMISKALESREGVLWTSELVSDVNGLSNR